MPGTASALTQHFLCLSWASVSSLVPCCVLATARVVQQQTGHPLTIAIWAAVPDVLLLVRQRVMDVGIANHQILKYNFGIDPEGSLGLVLLLET